MSSNGALLRRDLFVFMVVGIVLICLFILSGGFGIASADDVIYEQEVSYTQPASEDYQLNFPYSYSPVTRKPDRFCIDTAEVLTNVYRVTVVVDSDAFTPAQDSDGNNIYSLWAEHVGIYSDAGKTAQIGNITHGYIYHGGYGTVSYVVEFHDFDSSGLSGNTYAFFNALGETGGGFEVGYVPVASYMYDYLDPGQMSLAGSGDHLYAIGWYPDGPAGDPDHLYTLMTQEEFQNIFYVESLNVSGWYKFSIWREDQPGWSGRVASRYIVYSSDYIYFNQSNCVSTNQSVLMFADCCEWLDVTVITERGSTFNYNISGICEVPELGYFDLSGYTRSVYGNIVPDVSLTAQGETEYSNNISFYEFADLETGSFDLAWNKTGYHNDSVSMYIGTPGDYERDVYLVPLDALDEGEFGGVVYDYCTHKSIQGAYVYLFNETADSGKYAYSNKYGFYRFAGMTEDFDYEISASKDGYDASIVHSFTFNESNVNETHCKTKNIWLLPEDGCPEDGGVPTPPPAPTPTPHEWTNEEIVSWLRVNLMELFIIVLIVTFLWFLRKAGGSRW